MWGKLYVVYSCISSELGYAADTFFLHLALVLQPENKKRDF